MFRHTGKGRTYSHDLKLASILSAVAGLVNITGVLAVNHLTTNVTGHFAFFSEQLFLTNYKMAFIYLLYILFFLLGAFISGLLIEWTAEYKPHRSYIIPLSIEIVLILVVGFSPELFPDYSSAPLVITSILLFAMGLQNALVTRVSHSVVRTTHLTGLFTDLGIELSLLFFRKQKDNRTHVSKSIILKMMIIICFFSGGILGALSYQHIQIKTLLFPATLLLIALWYDRLVTKYYQIKRKLKKLYLC